MCNIRLKNVSCLSTKSLLLEDISFLLKKNKTLSIIGVSGSGKTTLVKALCGLIPYTGEISIDGENDKENFSNCILPVFYEDLFTTFSIKEYITKEEKKELEEFFSLSKLLSLSYEELSFKDKVLLHILKRVLARPKYIVIDDLLIYLDYRTKVLLLNYLNRKNILLIQVTSDLEDVLFTDYVLCLYNGKVAMDGKTLEVLKKEKLLKRMGFSLPFYVDLSIQLELYGLLNKIYLNKEDLVKILWK